MAIPKIFLKYFDLPARVFYKIETKLNAFVSIFNAYNMDSTGDSFGSATDPVDNVYLEKLYLYDYISPSLGYSLFYQSAAFGLTLDLNHTTANYLDIKFTGTAAFRFSSSVFNPSINNSVTNGTTSLRWSSIFGYELDLTGTVTATNYKALGTFGDSDIFTSTTGVTPDGLLTGAAGDWCLDGSGGGLIWYCTGTTNWTGKTGNTNYSWTEVTSGTYTILKTDYILGVTYTATGVVTLTLPTISASGKVLYIIKDEGQGSASNNITINSAGSDTIEDSTETQIILDKDGIAITLYNNGTDTWFISGGA